jgi:hypothetical protein
MAKGKKRHKARGKCDKVLVIGPFINDAHLEAYRYVLGKYGMRDAAHHVDEMIEHDLIGENGTESLEILSAEEDNPPRLRVEDIIQRK